MTDRPPADRSQFLDRIGFGFAEDGRVIELQFLRRNGKAAYVPCEFDHLAPMVQKIEEATGIAWNLQKNALKGIDPRTFYPIATRQVTDIQAALAQGKLILTIVTTTGLRTNLGFDEDTIQKLIDDLEEAKQSLSTKSPPRN
jgi:hypothetical protein